MPRLTHLLLRHAVGPYNGRGTGHVDTALVVFDVVISHRRGDEAIEETLRVLLFTAELVLAVLVGGGGSLPCGRAREDGGIDGRSEDVLEVGR